MNKSIIKNIQKYSEQTENISFYSIANFIIININNINNFSISSIAKLTNTSPSSVTRFCKKIGLKGFKALSTIINVEREYKINHDIHNTHNVDKKYLDLTQKLVFDSLNEAINRNIDSFEKAACILKNSKRIFIFCKGDNISLSSTFVNLLVRMEFNVLYSYDTDQQITYSKNVTKSDTVIIISYSLSSSFFEKIFDHLNKEAKFIYITKNLHSEFIIRDNVILEMGQNENIIRNSYSSEMSTSLIFKVLIHSLLDDNTIETLRFK